MVFVAGEFPKDDVAGFDVFDCLLFGFGGDCFGVVAEIEDQVGAASVIDVGVGDEHAGVHTNFCIFLNGLLKIKTDRSQSANYDVGASAAICGDISHRIVDLVVCAGVLCGFFELGARGIDDGILEWCYDGLS